MHHSCRFVYELNDISISSGSVLAVAQQCEANEYSNALAQQQPLGHTWQTSDVLQALQALQVVTDFTLGHVYILMRVHIATLRQQRDTISFKPALLCSHDPIQ